MKLTFILACVSALQISANVLSQNTMIRFNVSSNSFGEIISAIEEQSEFKIFYKNEQVNLDRRVTLDNKTTTVSQILNEALDGTDIGYTLIDKVIVLSPSKEKLIRQQQTITGTVTDADGLPLPGVTVSIKGTLVGTITDAQGAWSLADVSADAVVVFSFVGMQAQEVLVGNQQVINIILQEETIDLEQVVVVGYGSIKKVNLTGSVDNVSGAVMSERPVTNSANLLQGRLTGVDVTQPGAEPGQDDPVIRIRGLGSYGSSNDPLILIDGVAGKLNNLSPTDIESVTVLKDAASAAIYGARAANGVILVTTKKGQKGAPVISYTGNLAIQSPTRLPDFITNSAEYMEMYNTASINDGRALVYTQAQIDAYRNAPAGSHEYPNFDACDYWFQNAQVQNHNLSISGGGENNLYSASFSYLDQNSMIPGYRQKRYNALLNYVFDLKKWVTLGTTINLTNKYTKQPAANRLFTPMYIYCANPLNEPFLPDGSGRVVTRAYASETFRGRPGLQEAEIMGRQYRKENDINPQAYIDIKPFKGLTWTTKFAVDYVDEFYKMHQQNYTAYYLHETDPVTGDYLAYPKSADVLGLTDDYSKDITQTLYSVATYQTKIADNHDLSVLAGYEQIDFRHQQLRVTRPYSVDPSLTELQAYSPDNTNLFNSTVRMLGYVDPYEWALQSLFGRINYGYKNKYLFEANLRYDGTSRVSPDYRWGAFPSVSAGWVVSEEGFVKDNVDWLSFLKLRASYGVLGNSDMGGTKTGAYAYQDNMDISEFYPFGSSLTQAAVINTFKDKSLKWEYTRITDLGLDMTIKNGLLGIVFDWFDKYTYDILANQPIPASMGLGEPRVNDGEMENKGFEIAVTHRHHFGELFYDAYFQLSHYKNEVKYIRAPSIGSTIRDIGYPWNEFNLYVWDGIFQEADITSGNYPTHAANQNPKAGDLKMKDVDGDGDVDADDRVPTSGLYPDFTYSFGLNFDYKHWGLSLFFQGVEGRKSVMSYWGPQPFAGGTPPTTKWRDAWTPSNPTNELPALHIDGYSGVNSYSSSTYFMQDGSYLRLKSVMLSYNLPVDLISRINCKELTLFVSGENLLTFTKFEGQDPERSLDLYTNVYLSYPQARIINFGLNVKF